MLLSHTIATHTHLVQQVQHWGADSGVLALNGPGLTDRSRVNHNTLQQDLSLDCDRDLHVVLAFAEKIQPST